MRFLKMMAVAVVLLNAVAGPAMAHTPFVKPASFTPNGVWTSLSVAYSTQVFCPAVGLGPPDSFQLLGPDGRHMDFASVEVNSYETTLQAPLPASGTYRVSTGEVLGRIDHMIYEHRVWRALGASETPPRGARLTTMQMVMVAEAYVTKGAPTQAALVPLIGTLAIRPISHPNQVSVDSGLDLQLFFNGAPFPQMPFVVYPRGASEGDMLQTFVTDRDGRAHLRFNGPGMYLVAVRYRTAAPSGAGVEIRSYSTTLAIEVRGAHG